MFYRIGPPFLIAMLGPVGCNDPMDLGRDFPEGPVAIALADPVIACAVGSLKKGAHARLDALDYALQQTWVPCGKNENYGFALTRDGTLISLRRAPKGGWERDMQHDVVTYHLNTAPGAPEGLWAFEIVRSGGSADGDLSLPVYGYFTEWPLRLVLSNHEVYAPLP